MFDKNRFVANPSAAYRFGYDAVSNTGKRKPPSSSTKSEDFELRFSQRGQMLTANRDLQRNFTIAAWAIRKHLDYVSQFTFQSRTKDKALDNDIEGFISYMMRVGNFDATGRFNGDRFFRMAEARRTVDGDCFILFRKDGYCQLIEGDRVGVYGGIPPNIDPLMVVNGIVVDGDGRHQQYIVNKRRREGGGMEFDKLVSAKWVVPHGYYDRYDQVRGISPLAPAINTLRDVYEGFDYALAKAKVSQLFALAFYRENSDEMGTVNTSTDTDTDGNDVTRYDIDFGKGPVKLDLDPGDRAEFLESRNPSTEFQAFTNSMIMCALKALDIPMCFYDESHTNFSGSRQATLQYQMACRPKRQDNVELRNRWTVWTLTNAIADGVIKLPAGMTISDLNWTWVGQNIPWPLDPLKEITADVLAVKNRLKSPQQVAYENGYDPYEIADQIRDWEAYLTDIGVSLPDAAMSVNVNTQDANNGTDANNQSN